MRKLVFITVILFMSYNGLFGQISTQEDPISFRSTVSEIKSSEKAQKILLPSFDMKIIEKEEDGGYANFINITEPDWYGSSALSCVSTFTNQTVTFDS